MPQMSEKWYSADSQKVVAYIPTITLKSIKSHFLKPIEYVFHISQRKSQLFGSGFDVSSGPVNYVSMSTTSSFEVLTFVKVEVVDYACCITITLQNLLLGWTRGFILAMGVSWVTMNMQNVVMYDYDLVTLHRGPESLPETGLGSVTKEQPN